MRTAEIAKAAGVHPNTVRLYEEWGFLQPAPRLPNGYRDFTEAHLDQMLLAWIALHGAWPGRAIRKSALALVRLAATGDPAAARRHAGRHLELVRAERAQAEKAAAVLEEWARGRHAAARATACAAGLSIGGAAALLELTVDTLRSWERNGLIRPPRTPGGYRLYGAEEIDRLRVVRMLMRSGYSSMAVLRMLSGLERQDPADLRRILDTPRPDEDVFSASDRWITSLDDQEKRARRMIARLEKRR